MTEQTPTLSYTEAERLERDRTNIREALQFANGGISGDAAAAVPLGVKPTTLASRMKARGIGKPA